jgi:hypothetical protein
MALWHWILGGAAAYMLIKTTSATAAPAPASTITATINDIVNYINASDPNARFNVTSSNNGYALTDTNGNAVSQFYPTLDALFVYVKQQYPVAS